MRAPLVPGSADHRDTEQAGLGGTGRVADDLYLMAHHEVSGRPLLQPRALGTGLAAALLAELMLGGSIVMRPGGLASPAGGHLSLAALSPHALTSAGFGTFGVLAVVAVLGFVGFEQAPVLAEEARHARRTIPVATYAGAGHDRGGVRRGELGDGRPRPATATWWPRPRRRGRGCCSGWAAAARSAQVAQWLFLTSLFAAALAFHNTVWRYMYALGRENVLPAALARTGGNNIPKAASLAQSATGLAVIAAYALAHGDPVTGLFFGLGTTGGFGILILLALTAVAVIAFFARDARGETAWSRLAAPALAAVLLGGIVVLAVLHYGTLLGAGPGDPAAWALPGSYAAVTVIGLAWGLVLRARRPQVYAAIGLGARAVTGHNAPASRRTLP